LSQEAIRIIESSLTAGTSKQYRPYINKWVKFCEDRQVDPTTAQTTVGIEFLTCLFHESNVRYSAINTARSALSLIIDPVSGLSFGSQPLVRRFMTGIFKLKPALPRYVSTFDTNQVLCYLNTIQTSLLTPVKELSHKLAMLLCLLSGQRNQSISALDINFMHLSDTECMFYIPTPLKTTRPGHHLQPIHLKAYETNRNLCPVTLISTYLAVTAEFRGDCSLLFISPKPPHKPVTSRTLAKWCETTLLMAGINCSIFSAHATRSASTSMAQSKGMSLADINKAAGWTNSETFARFYGKPIIRNFGEAILT